ncbi:hypothetical protein [Fimbriiglobus ruber]|uniref:hypothetical protein n=1 Tax=Fimbriiglobus ruber TaxID=1908690 RepID=UPI001879012D|nr:hypothetical protein [Fimbriiglobus ruber]
MSHALDQWITSYAVGVDEARVPGQEQGRVLAAPTGCDVEQEGERIRGVPRYTHA